MTEFTTLPIEDLYESTLQSDLGEAELTAKTVKLITGTLTGGATCYMGIDYDKPSKYELVKINAINGQDVTIETRGVKTKAGGTGVAQFHAAGAKVIITHSYKVFEDIAMAIASKANSSSPTLTNPTLVNPVVNNYIDLPTYADGAARDVAIPTPADNMAVLLEDDGNGYTCLSVYKNAQWNNIALPSEDVTVYGFLEVADGYIRFPLYADDTARNAAIPAPTQGMTIYNQTAVTLQLYDGANWIDLDIGTPVPLATTTTPGRVRLATDAEVLAGTDFDGPNPLVVQPSQVGNVIQATLEENMSTGQIVGISQYISQSSPFVAHARFIERSLGIACDSNIKQVITLEPDRLFLVYNNSNVVKAAVIQMDYNTNTPIIGAEVTVTGGAISTVNMYDAAFMSTDKVAITYVLSATNTVVRCKIADVSGTTITLGSEQTVMTAGSVISTNNIIKMIAVDTDKAAVLVIPDTTTGSRMVAFTVSGTTITAGTPQSIGSNLRSIRTMLVFLDTDKFLLISGNNSTGRYQAGTISGTAITMGTEATWTTGGGNASCVFIEANKVLVTYRGSSSNGADTAKIITFSGTAIAVEGTPLSVSFAQSGYSLLLRSTNTVWATGLDGSFLFTSQFTISGTTITAEQLAYNLSLLNSGGQNGDTEIGPRNNTAIVASRAVYVYSGGGILRWGREGDSNNMVGVLTSGGNRGDTRAIKLYCPLLQSNQTFKAGEYYSYGISAAGVGTLSMVPGGQLTDNSNISTAGRNGEILAVTADSFIKM